MKELRAGQMHYYPDYYDDVTGHYRPSEPLSVAPAVPWALMVLLLMARELGWVLGELTVEGEF